LKLFESVDSGRSLIRPDNMPRDVTLFKRNNPLSGNISSPENIMKTYVFICFSVVNFTTLLVAQTCSIAFQDWWVIKMTVSWDVAPCSVVKIDRRFRAPLPSERSPLMTETVRICETSVYTRLHGAVSQKALFFILAAVRTWNLTLTLTKV
jgi:hypothetical protein